VNPYAPPQASPSTAPGPERLGGISVVGIIALSAIAANVTARWAVLSLDLANFGSIAARNVSPTLVLAEQIIGGLETLARLCSIVVFLVWVHQAASSVRSLGREGLTITPGMCVVWFFVPVMNLVMPYMAVSQIAVASDREGRGSTPGFVLAWWLLYIASNVAGVVRQLMGKSMADLGLRLGWAAIADVAAAGSLVALFLTIRFIDGGRRHWASVKLA
jgi:uncharacterized protein DUF4328